MNLIEVIESGDYLVLDTETTGLDGSAEICQIAIVDSTGKALLDTLVKPTKPIPAEATAIHGITNEMVQDANPFPHLRVFDLIYQRNVIVYNADYDVRMLYQSSESSTGNSTQWRAIANFHCAMKHFAKVYGDWNSYYKSFRWQSLDTACGYYGIQNTGAHSALADCQATLAVVKAMVRQIENADQPGEDW